MQGILQVGNTPLGEYWYQGQQIFIKQEFYNPSGSMKDRAAWHILTQARQQGIINDETTIIESSSGNFGIALAMACTKMHLPFICVIDSNTNRTIEQQLELYGAQLIKIDRADAYGGYLVNRLNKVQELLTQSTNIYWINQYANELNAESYGQLADEIIRELPTPDYVFIPVSSGGTITGVSRRLKEWSPHTQIIAVDSQGSVIFGGQAQKRQIPGMGSSIVPPILQHAMIDDVILVEEVSMIRECHQFLSDTGSLIGGSSGACLHAIAQYCRQHALARSSSILTIFPDRGDRYLDTIYNDKWCQMHYNIKKGSPSHAVIK